MVVAKVAKKKEWAALNCDSLAAHLSWLVEHPGLDFHSDEEEQVDDRSVKLVLHHSFRSALATDLLHALDSEQHNAAQRRMHPDRSGAPLSVRKAKRLLECKHAVALYDLERVKAVATSEQKKRANTADDIIEMDGQVSN